MDTVLREQAGVRVVRRTVNGTSTYVAMRTNDAFWMEREIDVRQVRHMDPERKALWLAQLLSGTYRQGQHRLVAPGYGAAADRYCCLGVLADLCPAVRESAPERPTDDRLRLKFAGEQKGNDGLLTPGLRRWAGLTNPAQDFLAALNDNGWTFEEIAVVVDTLL